MGLKNANIGAVVGVAIFALGSFLTNGDPSNREAMVIVIVMLGSAFGACEWLDKRDERLGRTSQRWSLRR